METKDLIAIIEPYCDRIRQNKHFVCYPKDLKRTIVISSSPSYKRNRHRQVYREFRRAGIIIKELEKYLH